MRNSHAIYYFWRLVLLRFRLADRARIADPSASRRPPARLARYGLGGLGLVALALIPPTASAAPGRTPAEIHERFSGVVWSNLNTPAAAARLESLSEFEMQKLAGLYINASHGGPPLQGIIKQNAPGQAARYERAVVAVLAQRGIDPVRRWPAPRQKVGAPNDFMTFDEIFMEFRTAGSSVATAIYETSRFAGGELWWAAAAGYAAGSVISYGLQTYCPTCDNAIGAKASQVVNYTPPPDTAPSGTQSGYADPTGGWGPDAGSDPSVGGGGTSLERELSSY